MSTPRERQLEEVLRELIATIDLATDCMDGRVDRTMLDLYIENAEALLDGVPVLGVEGVLGDFVGQWIDADRALPDSDTTVLISTPDSSEPVWLGFHDGECWRNVEGFPIAVTGWAEMPDLCERQPTKGVAS